MFIAGGYIATFKGAPVGLIEDGFLLEWTIDGEPISGDILGDAILDGVYRCGNLFISFTLLEYDAQAAQSLFWPHNPTLGTIGTPGVLISTMYGQLTLRKVIGPNALPTIWQFNSCGLAPGFPVRILLAPRLRRVPLRLMVLPEYMASQNPPTALWFTTQ